MTEGNGEVRELPKGWASTMVQEVIEIIDYRGRTPPFSENGIPHLRSSNVKNGKIIWKDLRYVSSETYQAYMTRGLPEKDDVLFTTEAPLGEVAIAPDQRFSFAQRLMILKPNRKCLLPKFLLYQIQSAVFQRNLKKIGTGTTVAGVSSRNFQPISLVLTPIKEQQRIVEKLEELFSSMNQGSESLKTAQKQLKIYRQVILKWAFEGKLTEKWRSQIQQEKLDIKTGEELLAQIKAERENRYQQQLEEWGEAVREWEAIGKLRKKPSKPQKPKDLSPLTEAELSSLTQLPDSWCWIKIGDVSRIGTGVTPLKKVKEFYENGAIPWVTSGALNKAYVKKSSDFVTELALEKTNLKIYPIHTLVVALYGEGKTRGKCSELLIEAATNQAIAAIVQVGVEEEKRPYLKCFLQKNYDEIRLKSSGGVQPNLNLSIIENTVFPMCCLDEQEQIVQEIESRLSICAQLEATIIENIQKAEALRQSILKQAFEGKLVPQDPNDEPAEKLLERIKQEKIKVKKGKQLSIEGI